MFQVTSDLEEDLYLGEVLVKNARWNETANKLDLCDINVYNEFPEVSTTCCVYTSGCFLKPVSAFLL